MRRKASDNVQELELSVKVYASPATLAAIEAAVSGSVPEPGKSFTQWFLEQLTRPDVACIVAVK